MASKHGSTLTRPERERILHMFQAIDKTNDGYIDWDDVQNDLVRYKDQAPDIMATFTTIMEMDTNKDGKVSKAEFLAYFENQMSEREVRDRASRTFRRYDVDDSGTLSKEEITDMLRELGIHQSSNQIQKMFELCDRQKDHAIGEADFCQVVWEYMKNRHVVKK